VLFNSLEFWIFLPVVWLVYFALPQTVRWVFLLLSSYFFYGFWQIEFAGLMLFTSVVDWYCAQRLFHAPSRLGKQFWMWLAIGSDLAMLFAFKYFDFALGKSPLAQSLYHMPAFAWMIELGKYVIPAGISFYTFQSISYVVDIYRGQEKPEPNVVKFMLFVSFFPQLVAGPIERFGKLHNQLFSAYQPKLEDLKNGGRLLLYGLFLKVAVADNLAGVVDLYYSDSQAYSQFSAWIATFMFTFQVYYDFFGYSLMAQGAALLFGIHLMDNFNKPFLAQSVPEFWHRWHISLSTWFRDYIYIPIGGNKGGTAMLVFGVLLVFFTSGLWHGANATMIYFGLAQGVLYLFDRFVFRKTFSGNSFGIGFRRLKTAFFFMSTLVFFRSGSVGQSLDIFEHLWVPRTYCETPALNLAIDPQVWLFLLVGLILDHAVVKVRVDRWISPLKLGYRWFWYLFFLTAVLLFGGAVNHPFVYFQF
jgi:D-alanyl-lipoteichoic acid acyltransferase DltB (MBOAT superfamily)